MDRAARNGLWDAPAIENYESDRAIKSTIHIKKNCNEECDRGKRGGDHDVAPGRGEAAYEFYYILIHRRFCNRFVSRRRGRCVPSSVQSGGARQTRIGRTGRERRGSPVPNAAGLAVRGGRRSSASAIC